jgi:hypothetical protein
MAREKIERLTSELISPTESFFLIVSIKIERTPTRFIIPIGWVESDACFHFRGATDCVERPRDAVTSACAECFGKLRFVLRGSVTHQKFVFAIAVEHSLAKRPKIVTGPKDIGLASVS